VGVGIDPGRLAVLGVVVVDGDDEAVIQIEGNLTRDEASRLFQSDGKGLSILEGLEISGD